MKIPTSRLSGAALSWAVNEIMLTSKEENVSLIVRHNSGHVLYDYVNSWDLSGPIFEDEMIEFHNYPYTADYNFRWAAFCNNTMLAYGSSMLEAGLRAFVQSRLGSLVDVPDLES